MTLPALEFDPNCDVWQMIHLSRNKIANRNELADLPESTQQARYTVSFCHRLHGRWVWMSAETLKSSHMTSTCFTAESYTVKWTVTEKEIIAKERLRVFSRRLCLVRLNQTHFPLWYALQVRDKHLPGLNTYALYSGMLQGTVDVQRSVQTSNEPWNKRKCSPCSSVVQNTVPSSYLYILLQPKTGQWADWAFSHGF